MHGCSYFYAKAVKTKVVAEDLEGEKATRQVEEATMKIQLGRKMDMEHTAAMLKVKKSTRTFVVYTCHLLHLLYRSLNICVPYMYAIIKNSSQWHFKIVNHNINN